MSPSHDMPMFSTVLGGEVFYSVTFFFWHSVIMFVTVCLIVVFCSQDLIIDVDCDVTLVCLI